MFVDDAFARFAKVTILLSAAAVLLMSEGYMARAASCGSNTRC
jgi:NADH-quinone oxidoreductase subunit N